MKRRTLLIGATGLLVARLIAGVALAQTSTTFDLSWHVLAGGGGRADSTHYAIHGTLGQVAVGYSDSTSYGLQSGFWQKRKTHPMETERAYVSHIGQYSQVAAAWEHRNLADAVLS